MPVSIYATTPSTYARTRSARHDPFGKVSSGQDIVDAIAQGDIMTTIVIEGDASSLLAAQKEQVDGWNRILDRR